MINLQYLQKYLTAEHKQQIIEEFVNAEILMVEHEGSDHPAFVLHRMMGEIVLGDRLDDALVIIKQIVFNSEARNLKNFVANQMLPIEPEKMDWLVAYFHKKIGEIVFGDDLDEAIDFINKSVAMQKIINNYVHDKTLDILVKMFAEQLKIDLSK